LQAINIIEIECGLNSQFCSVKKELGSIVVKLSIVASIGQVYLIESDTFFNDRECMTWGRRF